MNTIRELNKTLEVDARIPVTTVKQFKLLHKNTPSSKIDGLVRRIESVEKLTDGYKISFDSGDTLAVRYDGAINKNGTGYKFNIDAHTGHNRIKVLNYNSSLYPEKIIGICDAVLKDCLPISFKGLVVNSMDGSGSFITADKLGIKPCFIPENLEWTTISRNSWHGTKILKIAEKVNAVYRFSANDQALIDAWDTKNKLWLKHYMLMNYTKINDYTIC